MAAAVSVRMRHGRGLSVSTSTPGIRILYRDSQSQSEGVILPRETGSHSYNTLHTPHTWSTWSQGEGASPHPSAQDYDGAACTCGLRTW